MASSRPGYLLIVRGNGAYPAGLYDVPEGRAVAMAGRKHVEKHYNAELQGEKLAGLYRELHK